MMSKVNWKIPAAVMGTGCVVILVYTLYVQKHQIAEMKMKINQFSDVNTEENKEDDLDQSQSMLPVPGPTDTNTNEQKQEKEVKEANTLHPELKELLTNIRAKRNFNVKEWINNKCSLFNDYMNTNGLSGCVINLSGGVDSAVTLGLMKYASNIKGSNIKKILAVSQPIHSSNWAYNRALECAKVFDTKLIELDQTKIFDALKELIDNKVGLGVGSGFAGGQLKSYMRTPSIYYVTQLLSSHGFPSIVMGTGNKDEDGYLAYFCKAGDGVVDVQLISELHKSEVFRVGKELNVPQSILTAAPSADLWDGQTDEDELGFTYDFIELWTNFLELNENKQKEIKNELSKEALNQLNEWSKKAIKIHNRNKHKLVSPYNIISTV